MNAMLVFTRNSPNCLRMKCPMTNLHLHACTRMEFRCLGNSHVLLSMYQISRVFLFYRFKKESPNQNQLEWNNNSSVGDYAYSIAAFGKCQDNTAFGTNLPGNYSIWLIEDPDKTKLTVAYKGHSAISYLLAWKRTLATPRHRHWQASWRTAYIFEREPQKEDPQKMYSLVREFSFMASTHVMNVSDLMK